MTARNPRPETTEIEIMNKFFEFSNEINFFNAIFNLESKCEIHFFLTIIDFALKTLSLYLIKSIERFSLKYTLCSVCVNSFVSTFVENSIKENIISVNR